ncbi:related to acriflavine resistance protein E [Precursor] septum formation and cell membrane permeability [Desulfotalea psychrophila LSv54]|uniref:Related to acriflavine resistance protein E [Precursor] septum formation and cell membrane permeability n=2 Tax=Desulfotalea psychrophila TaxID=84980 RepID=Q6AMJ8_DESPS|nr:related to acriflavine resistance protein E [Precursor] septum formation and cell membrane permeability [Desulfotalea psychrophila LSv54]
MPRRQPDLKLLTMSDFKKFLLYTSTGFLSMKTTSFVKYCTGFALALVFCSPLSSFASEEPTKDGQKAPATAVSAITLKPTAIQYTQQIPARATAYKVAEIRPQVTGIIKKRLFTEGGAVKKGSQLYQIDPAPYQAVYNSAKADLLKAHANLESTNVKEKRYAQLVLINAVSKQAYDDTWAALLQAKADVAIAEASVASAKINLKYTKVYAPISGLIGKSNVTEGALVTANQAPLMAQITQLDPIYIDMQEVRNKVLVMKQKAKNTEEILVNLDFGGNLGIYQHQGKLQFSDVIVNPTTASVELRAIFPNPEQILFPGLFAYATLLLDEVDVLLIPQQAAIRGLKGKVSAWTINDKSQAVSVSIKVGESYGNNWIVTEGLKAGDKVITEGFQRLRTEATVKITAPQDTAKK